MLTVEGRRQRPERRQPRGHLSHRHDTPDLPSTIFPSRSLEEATGRNSPVRRPVAALGWCRAAAADKTPASPAATAGPGRIGGSRAKQGCRGQPHRAPPFRTARRAAPALPPPQRAGGSPADGGAGSGAEAAARVIRERHLKKSFPSGAVAAAATSPAQLGRRRRPPG
ncbi:unnamed protein product [Coccothraustes coccothraustes]